MAKLVKIATDNHLDDQDQDTLPNTLRIAALAADIKAGNLLAYDVRGLTLIADAFVLCNATSPPHVKAILNNVRDGMKEIGVSPLHAEGGPGDGWIVLDYGTTIFHIFSQEAREFYDLDGLWGDAPLIDLDLDDEDEHG